MGAVDARFEEVAAAQDEAIHAIAQYVLNNQAELRDALVRGRLGDRKDLADDLAELLAAWSAASTAVRDAVVAAARGRKKAGK
jgi:hypothetical protein